MARLYVALRLIQSLIYFSHKHVLHRFAVFATSNLVALAMIGHLGAGIV